MKEQKIALNAQRRPNRGRALESTIEDYDRLTSEPWLAEMIDEIRNGNEELKSELPFRCAHYFRFRDNHRTQKNADPEAFTFQTTVDIDEKPIVADAIKKAQELHNDESSMWHDMLRHIEYSARGKAHIDVLMPIGLTIAETQQQFCKALGVPYDESCITPERFIYVTDDRQEVFRHPEWYKVFEGEELAARQKAFTDRGLTIDGRGTPTQKVGEKPIKVSDPLIDEKLEKATVQNLTAFDLCVKEAGLDPEQMDVWGEHNWHNNLMAVMSVGLPKLMSKEQLMAVVKEKLPNYSQTEDCQKTIKYFYDNYTADMGFMSTTLREINAKAQSLSLTLPRRDGTVGEGESDDDDKVMNELTEGWAPPALPKKIPRLLNLLVNNYDPRFRQMLLLSALPVLSAHASHFRARYLSDKIVGCQQYVAIIGSSGSDKGHCTDLYNEMIEYTLQANDDMEWEKVRENAELRDKLNNAKERPPKYHPKLRLFETTSKSSILELQTNLGKNGMLLGQFSEVDGLSGSSRAVYSDISVQLRKGWDGDMQRQYYMSDTTCNTYVRMNISLLMSGTVKAMLQRMFTENACEGGLMQRCIPVLVPKGKRTFRPPKQQFLTDDEKKERDALLIELYQKDVALGDETQLLDLPMTNRAIGHWFDELEELYNDGRLTEAEADLSHRCGEFIFRTAIPLVALYGKETKEIIDFCVWVGRIAHYNMCKIFGSRVQRNLITENELMSQSTTDARKTAEPLLSKMPQIFTIQQLKELRVKDGQSEDVKALLSRYCKKGKLIRVGRGVYKKGNIVSETKMRDCPETEGNQDEHGTDD